MDEPGIVAPLLFQKVFTAIAPPGPRVIWVIDRALRSDPHQCVHPWDQSAASAHFLFCQMDNMTSLLTSKQASDGTMRQLMGKSL